MEPTENEQITLSEELLQYQANFSSKDTDIDSILQELSPMPQRT